MLFTADERARLLDAVTSSVRQSGMPSEPRWLTVGGEIYSFAPAASALGGFRLSRDAFDRLVRLHARATAEQHGLVIMTGTE